jgi:hypothetical protein
MLNELHLAVLEAATPAGCRCVLGDEDWVVPHLSLLAIIRWIAESRRPAIKFSACSITVPNSLALQVFLFSVSEAETATEGRTVQPLEDLSQIAVNLRSPIRRRWTLGMLKFLASDPAQALGRSV